MKKNRLPRVFFVILLLALSGSAFAQLRFDIDLMLPFSAGLIGDIQSLGGNTSVTTEKIPFTLLIPDFQLLGEAKLGMFRLGGGLRLFTIILESVAFPTAFAEFILGPMAINLSLGGFVFGFIGLYSNIHSFDIMVADLSAGLNVASWFRVTAGYFGITPFSDMNNFIGLFYIGGKFMLAPAKKARAEPVDGA